MALLPAFGTVDEAQAQGVVVVDDGDQRPFQRLRIQHFPGRQQQRLVPVLTLGDGLFEEVMLRRGQDHLAADRALIDAAAAVERRDQRQATHGLVLEQIPRAEANARLAGTADHLDGNDRVAAELEEIVFEAHRFCAQYVLPDLRQRDLHRILWRNECLLRRGVGRRQSLAVELAVGGHRQGVQRHQVGGHHVFRQAVEQPGLEGLRPLRIGVGVFQHQIRHQMLAALHQHHGLTHQRMLHQPGFDFPQFDAQATQFDLMVEAPEVFDHPIGALPHAVAGAVQARTVMEGARHKTLGAERRTPVITARQPGATEVQLPRHAGRNRQ
ncbi:hypothetical protein D3C76_825880 [compost metagenome]